MLTPNSELPNGYTAIGRQSTAYAGGDVGEIVAVSGVLSKEDRQNLDGYLARRWGMRNELPDGHPGKVFGMPMLIRQDGSGIDRRAVAAHNAAVSGGKRMVPHWIIEKKRDGGELESEEIEFLIRGYTRGDVPDYQMAAFAMAVYFRGMTAAETAAMTGAMMRSGDVLDLSALRGFRVDKHSTGGVGDKVSLVLAPLVAAAGALVPMMSGRGLGITGGTLDKLQAIPGFRTDLSADEFRRVLEACGFAMIGQTERLAPADRKLYALRDVTATVPSIPLICSSILCKKFAEDAQALVLDVKCGEGAFMRTRADARALAKALVGVAREFGKGLTALITPMNQPLGRAVGNALETREAVAALRGEGPADLMATTLALGAHMLLLAGLAPDAGAARARLDEALRSGAAYERFLRMVRLQGGDAAAVENPDRLPVAPLRVALPASRSGTAIAVHAERIARACILLGAGRRRADDPVDPAVGIAELIKVGESVERGAPLMTVHASDRGRLDEALSLLAEAVRIGEAAPVAEPAVLEILGDTASEGGRPA